MQLTCPWCGPRDIEEFTFGGDASVPRPQFDNMSPDDWKVYLFERDNPCGPHREFWHHEAGCRQWIVAMRDTSDHTVLSTRLTADSGT